ncbi:zinc ribbon domain-containing protein [Herbaspirillum sp. C7C2]|uniref:zinc ribbon domain-containing protein n=1 Tax=Herbaspirillum sp. C7C2 TaxID=2736666 RepID=UPI001F51B868|nr:zinc ribbon domain-containing protein [Herbaspirillum sp. C7C2]MCI1012807.1 zinc ribbon domain-containing protein [Herbaspirillum sp. C7C2]
MTAISLDNAPPLSAAEETEVTQLYEERAEHLGQSIIEGATTLTSDTEEWIGALTGGGSKLLVGPRGCGKTHLMRFAFLMCQNKKELPFAVYTNLNRYYRLEPMLRRRPDAMAMFYYWALSNIFIGISEAAKQFSVAANVHDTVIDNLLEFDGSAVSHIIATLEQGRPLSPEQDSVAARLSIDKLKAILVSLAEVLGRKRIVLFLDDAALTLTPEYLSHFFDIYRALKSTRIALKASVYPGTTEYGPSFHASHEAESIFVWKSVTDVNYLDFMLDIGNKRFSDLVLIPEETRVLLAYAAFGVPRAFMTLVRAYLKNVAKLATPQAAFNRTIEEFVNERRAEYLTLKDKIPQFSSIVEAGLRVFDRAADDISQANQALIDGSTRQLLLGIDPTSVVGQPYVERMLRLLEEVGLLYKLDRVSHGDREYLRYVVHLGALQFRRAFSRRGAFSPRFSMDMLQRPDEKHPVRRSVSTLLDANTVATLGLNLPNCRNCDAKRVEGAKYCFNCGEKLTEESTYDRMMLTLLIDVPGLTKWQKEKLGDWRSVPRTVGEFVALQDPGTTLRTIPHVGKIRARTIIDAVEAFLDEYLS